MQNGESPAGNQSWLCQCGLIAFIVLVSGCGPRFDSSVVGVVKLDGKPLDRGTVVFHPDDRSKAPVYGHIGSDGRFVMRVGQGDDGRRDEGGIPPGSYLVTVTSRANSEKSQDGGPPTPGLLLTPKVYASVDTSPLKLNIHPGKNERVIELESSAAGEPLSAEATQESANSGESDRLIDGSEEAGQMDLSDRSDESALAADDSAGSATEGSDEEATSGTDPVDSTPVDSGDGEADKQDGKQGGDQR